MSRMGELTVGEPYAVREMRDGTKLELPGLWRAVAHAPGHTKGSVTFGRPEAADIPPILFSCDLLFAGSIGRTDLPGGDSEQMMRSLAEKVLPLPDDVVVLPGHGEQTSIGQERATNPYLLQLAGGPGRPVPTRGL